MVRGFFRRLLTPCKHEKEKLTYLYSYQDGDWVTFLFKCKCGSYYAETYEAQPG